MRCIGTRASGQNKTPDYQRAAGRPLNPTRINTQTLATRQQELGTYVWSAQYQQEPCPIDGGIVKES